MISLPGSNPTRSLMNARSFSLDGSTSAKSGTRRNNSNSCFRLIYLPPFSCRLGSSFGCEEEGHQRTLGFEFGRGPLLLQLAVAHDKHPVEVAGQACAVQHPD